MPSPAPPDAPASPTTGARRLPLGGLVAAGVAAVLVVAGLVIGLDWAGPGPHANGMPDPCYVFADGAHADTLAALGISQSVPRERSTTPPYCGWGVASDTSPPHLMISYSPLPDNRQALRLLARSPCSPSAPKPKKLGLSPHWNAGCLQRAQGTWLLAGARRANVVVSVLYNDTTTPGAAQQRAVLRAADLALAGLDWKG